MGLPSIGLNGGSRALLGVNTQSSTAVSSATKWNTGQTKILLRKSSLTPTPRQPIPSLPYLLHPCSRLPHPALRATLSQWERENRCGPWPQVHG